MNRALLMLVGIALPVLLHGDEAKIDWQKGKCLGGNQPSRMCKNCSTCWYCGKKGRYGARPENSATCVVCEGPVKPAK